MLHNSAKDALTWTGPRAYPSEGKNPSAYFNMSWTYPLAASILGCESVYRYFTICDACWQVPSLNTQDLLIGNSFNVAVKASDHQAVKRPKASTTWVKGWGIDLLLDRYGHGIYSIYGIIWAREIGCAPIRIALADFWTPKLTTLLRLLCSIHFNPNLDGYLQKRSQRRSH